MRLLPAFASGLAIVASSAAPYPLAPASPVERVAINDNRTPAGTLRDGVLTIRLEAREGDWHPDADSARGLTVRAFAEQGRPLSIPGPLIRVPEGTEIHAYVTNTFTGPLILRGLRTHGATAAADTLQIAAGDTRELRFAAGSPGTYYYAGHLEARSSTTRGAVDAELSGAFIVDPRGAVPRDRVFLIALWSSDSLPGGAVIQRNSILRFSINGKAWPNTERLAYDLGDTVRFRVINTSTAVHPMHLHGFYFDVNSRGNGVADSIYPVGSPPYRVVTERTPPSRTFTMSWVPERAGNWLFHCHDNFHVLRNAPLDGAGLPAEHRQHVTNHALDMMGGLVMGIQVRGQEASGVTLAGASRRRLRLVAQVDAGGTDSEPSFGYLLQEGTRATSSVAPMLPGPTIILKRGEPVAITVVNRLSEPTAVHWHGMELDSYFDGVADFAGTGKHIAGAIAPNDSFEARFTPPRSGTFMYHPHADEVRQQQAGLSGALLVVDDPAAFDPAHDIVMLLTAPRSDADGRSVLVNGSLAPPPLDLRVGERYRLRIVNVHISRPSMITRLLRDSSLVTWRAVAKDGMDLPPQRATMRPAMQQLGNGETYDFELAPTAPGDLRFTVTSAVGAPLASVPVRVR
jgi:FtsP/CotA-like multicopper oxidase with cupredoxin domain